jgi:DNA-binding PucR family transcriptional regulator
MKLAVEVVDAGLDGFRRSHSAALQAHHVGHLTPFGDFWAYEEIRVVALLAKDQTVARMFVRRELEGLMGSEPRMVELRNTVRQLLRAGSSRSAAAQILNVATNTVTYRVGRAGELLGRSVADQPVETLLALDLADYIPQFIGP